MLLKSIRESRKLLKEKHKRWIPAIFQVIGIPVSLWAFAVMGSWWWFAASLLMFFLYKCLGVVITYHRILTHNVGRTSTFVRFILVSLGFYGSLCSPVAYAAVHMNHHKYVDTEKDPHSPLYLGWKGWFAGFWNTGGDIVTLRRLKKDWVCNLYDKHYYKMMCVPFVLLVYPPAFFFLWLFPFVLSVWSQHLSVYNHGSLGAEKKGWLFGLMTMGEHHHKWHHDHPNDTSGEGLIHYITKVLAHADSRQLSN
jgi:stearoyl-CoA desaturase (delta-9 desaturase)